MKRIVVAIVVVVAVLTISGACLLELAAPRLGRVALEAVGKTLGVGLSAAEYRWSFRRGLVLEGVESSSPFQGGRLTLRAEELVFEHRFLPLLNGTIVVERLRLIRPRVKLASFRPESNTPLPSAPVARRPSPKEGEPEEPGQPEKPERSGTEISLEVDEIAIEEGVLLWQRQGGRADLSLDGLHLVLRELGYDSRALTPVHGFDAAGEFRAKSVLWKPIAVRDLRGNLKMARGKIKIHPFALETENGSFHVDLALDLNQLPPGYAVRLSGRLDLGNLLGDDGGLNPAGLEMVLNGFGAGFAHLKGEGTVTLEEGKLPAWLLLTRMDAAVGGPALSRAFYENVTAPFRIEGGQLVFSDIEVRTDNANIIFGGTVAFDGPIALKVMIRKSSGEAVSLFVTGTVEEPVVLRADR